MADVVSVLAALLFGGVPCFGLGYAAARKWNLRNERVLALGAFLGIVLALGFMLWLRNAGIAFAFCALVGVFYGCWYGGKANEYKQRRTRVRTARKQRTGPR